MSCTWAQPCASGIRDITGIVIDLFTFISHQQIRGKPISSSRNFYANITLFRVNLLHHLIDLITHVNLTVLASQLRRLSKLKLKVQLLRKIISHIISVLKTKFSKDIKEFFPRKGSAQSKELRGASKIQDFN